MEEYLEKEAELCVQVLDIFNHCRDKDASGASGFYQKTEHRAYVVDNR